MGMGRIILGVMLAFSLAACGGGGGGGGNPPTGGGGGGNPPPTNTCSLSARQDFAFAVLDEWYLFPDLLDRTVNKANHSTVQSYLNALVAPARAQNKDKGFTFITSIQEEEDLINNGSRRGLSVSVLAMTPAQQPGVHDWKPSKMPRPFQQGFRPRRRTDPAWHQPFDHSAVDLDDHGGMKGRRA